MKKFVKIQKLNGAHLIMFNRSINKFEKELKSVCKSIKGSLGFKLRKHVQAFRLEILCEISTHLGETCLTDCATDCSDNIFRTKRICG